MAKDAVAEASGASFGSLSQVKTSLATGSRDSSPLPLEMFPPNMDLLTFSRSGTEIWLSGAPGLLFRISHPDAACTLPYKLLLLGAQHKSDAPRAQKKCVRLRSFASTRIERQRDKQRERERETETETETEKRERERKRESERDRERVRETERERRIACPHVSHEIVREVTTFMRP